MLQPFRKKNCCSWLLVFLLPALVSLLGACSKDSDIEPNVVSNLKPTIILTSPSMPIELLAQSSEVIEENPKFTSHWSTPGTYSIWAIQNGRRYYFDDVEASFLANSKTQVRLDLDLSSKLSPSEPYDLYVIGDLWRRYDNELFFRKTLTRGGSFGVYSKISYPTTNVEFMQTMDNTCEILFIINKSGQPIKFKHKGFDAEKKWYYTYAEVSMDDGHIVEQKQEDEVVSEEYDVPVYDGEKAYKFYSYYVPNGQKIQNAQLVAEINGKEVRSENRISSNISLQLNHCYGMFVIWDGEKLTFADNSAPKIGSIELPDEANVDFEDIKVISGCQEIEVQDNGCFETTNGTAVAFNNDKLVYLTYGCDDDKPILNSEETAISLLLPMIPMSIIDMDDAHLLVMKLIIGRMDETKALASAIEQSIKTHGYLDYEDINPQFTNAARAISNMLGMNEPSLAARRQSPMRTAPVECDFPYFTVTNSRTISADGFTVTLNSSTLEKENGKTVRRCKFTVLNGTRFCYTSLMKSYMGDNGLFGRYNPSLYSTFEYLIKPINISALMDFGTLTDLATDPKHFMNSLTEPDFERIENHFREPLKNYVHILKGEETETVTYDKTILKDAEFCFYGANEHLMIDGPGNDNEALILFNYLRIGFLPVFKFILGEVKSTSGYKKSDIWDKLFVRFVEFLAKRDAAFGAKLIGAFTNYSLSWGERYDLVKDDIWTHFKDFIQKELLLNTGSELFFEHAPFVEDMAKGYSDPEVKAIFAVYKAVLIGGDMLQLLLDADYKGCAFQMTQGFQNADGTLSDLPGQDL